jgi:hypothetical protein
MNRYKQRDEVLAKMGYASYQAYLASPLWAMVRRRLFAICDRCPCGEPATEAHHMSYKRKYLEGRGKYYKYITPVCRKCHESIEFDERGKTPLGWANHRLQDIREDAESRGIKMPYKTRMRRRSAKSRPAETCPDAREPGSHQVPVTQAQAAIDSS